MNRDFDRFAYLHDLEYRVARLVELLLLGHPRSQVKNFMRLSKHEFDHVLDCAVSRAQQTQQQVEERCNRNVA